MTIKTSPARVALMAAASVLALTSAAAAQESIRFWTTEEQPERLERQVAMAADFTPETGIAVEVIPVTESDLGSPSCRRRPTVGRADCGRHCPRWFCDRERNGGRVVGWQFA